MDAKSGSQTYIPPLDPLAGRVLANEFRITRLLGKGGMGAVYLGEQVSLQRRVAIKLLPFSAKDESESRQRFQREAIVAARLQHPNIVHVYYYGQHEGQDFIAMEFVEGESLAAYMKRTGKLPLDRSLEIARDVARALSAAHEQGLVHRDVKPENVFISSNGRVKLGDFGLARDLKGDGSLSVSGQVMGTPYYMPPEQCRGQKVDGRADIYALGATLYHLVKGQPPYKGDSTFDILNQHVSAPVPPAESFGPGAPPIVAELVRKMMAKDPADRPATGDAVAEEIDHILAALSPAEAAPAKATEPPTVRKGHGIAITACLLLAAVAAGAGWSWQHPASWRRLVASLFPPPPSPVSPPAPVTPTTPPPVPPSPPTAGDPPILKPALELIASTQYAKAIIALDSMPPDARAGPIGDRIKLLRSDALKQLNDKVAPTLKNCADLIGKGKLADAGALLDPLDKCEVAEIKAQVKALRSRIEEASKPRVTPDQAWGKLADDAWKLATQRKWDEAVHRCEDGKKEAALSSLAPRVAQLEALLDGARKTEQDVIKALSSLKGNAFSVPGEATPEMNGTLVEVGATGDLKIEPRDGKGLKVEVPFSRLYVPDLLALVHVSIAQDSTHHAAALVWALAVGESQSVDEFLVRDPAAADVRKALDPPAAGWTCPWSKEAVESRFKARVEVDKLYADLASKAWGLAAQRHWAEACDLCAKACVDARFKAVQARVACLSRLMDMGQTTDAAAVKGLKALDEKTVTLTRRHGGPVVGKVMKVSDAGDLILLDHRVNVPVPFDEIPTEAIHRHVPDWLGKAEHPFAAEIMFALRRGELETADALLAKCAEVWKNRSFFEVTSEGWDASPWSAAARERRARPHK